MTLALFTGFSVSVSAEEGDIEINETNFPDEKFREYISNFKDSDKNGSLSEAEIAAVTSIIVPEKSISDLKGIEFFTELTILHCYDNQLTSLNVSNNTELETLYCYNNNLTSLNVDNNTKLTTLYCYNNNLTSLDLSKNTKLITFSCHTNQITSLDLSKNTKLTTLYCNTNQLTSLDLSNNTELTDLKCPRNQLTSLDLSKNTELTLLWCGTNQLTSLDLSKNTKLTELSCHNNPLTSMTIPESVTSFGTLGFSNCTSLNQIIYKDGLDVSAANIPATTTQIKYTVSDGVATISAIEFGTGNILAVIPDTINGYSVAEITDKELMKKVAHTHTYENNVCTLCGTEKPNTGDDDNNNDSIDLKTDGSTLTISGAGAVNSDDLSAVADKESIKEVVIEDGITAVGSGAFDGFTGLETVTIPDSVQSIGSGAFDGTKLDTVFYESGAEVSGFPAGVTQVEYSVNGDGKIIIESIKQGGVVSEDGKIVIPDNIGGMDVAGVAEGIRDKVTVEGHAHSYENGSCTICGAADPNGGSGSQGTTPSNPSYPSAPSRPTNPSTPVVTPTVTTKTETAATTAEEEIISDGDYTGEDISSGAGDNSDDGGITDMSVVVLVIAIAAAISAAVLVKKLIF